MSDQLELMVKYLVHLQFYSEEEDVLFSRDKKHRLRIKGIGPVIAAFENVFARNLDLIRKKRFKEFLEAIAKEVQFDVEAVLIQFNDNARDLGSHNLTDELCANFLIGPVRSFLQTREFEGRMFIIKREAERRLGTPDAKRVISQRVSNCFSKNEYSVSMLHNLALLNYLTSVFGSEATKAEVQIVLDQMSEELIGKLVDGLDC
jgi:hypothetical protein